MNYLNNPPKNLLPLFLMDILQRKTDEDHRLNQEEIIRILEEEYQMKASRKTIRRTFEYLTDLNIGIQHEVTKKNTPQLERNEQSGKMEKVLDKDGKPVMMEIENWDNYYLIRDFEKSEIRLLIDSLLFSRLMPKKQCIDLAEKLAALAGPSFDRNAKYIHSLQGSEITNPETMLNVEILNEAISNKKWVAFYYKGYEADKKLHPRSRLPEDQNKCTALPLQLLLMDGCYYLICINRFRSGYGRWNYQMEYMTDMEILDQPPADYDKTKIPERVFNVDLGQYIKDNHPFYGRKATQVKMLTDRSMVDEVLHELGSDLTITQQENGPNIVTGKVNRFVLMRFAKLHAPHVKVLEPEDIVEYMQRWAQRVSKEYGISGEKTKPCLYDHDSETEETEET
ncbi:MAG: WYL domain-containing protein [Firmicutes bacterium]|nr:WYL domain-containing protein [Bacillota bacterium]